MYPHSHLILINCSFFIAFHILSSRTKDLRNKLVPSNRVSSYKVNFVYEEVIGKEEEFKPSKRLSAEASKLTKLSEDKLFEMIGEALLAQEVLKRPLEFLKSEGIKSVMSKTRKEDARKKGEIFVNKLRGRMFKKICVEAQACKWQKHVLDDKKGLVVTLVPLIGSIIGFTIPAITIAVAIIVTKRGIKKFCKCPPA